MGILNLIVGLFFIGIGFLVKAFPNLISGYNTMTKEQQENVDIESLSSLMKNSFIAIGVIIIVGSYFFNWIGLPMIASFLILISILGGVTIMIVKSRKFYPGQSDKKWKAAYVILGIVTLFIFGLLYHDSRPVEMVISKESVIIGGAYGVELPFKDIQEVKLVDKIPAITLRMNGFSFGPIKKGNFNLEEYGSCRLFLYSDSNPYLIIIGKNGAKTIINHENKSQTEKEFKRLKSVTTNS